MSGKNLLFIIDQEINWLSIAEKAVYKVIVRRCMSHKVCNYSASEIARQIGGSTRTVRRAVEILEACIAIKVDRKVGHKWVLSLGELHESRDFYGLDLSQYRRADFPKILEIDARRKPLTQDIVSTTQDTVSGGVRTLCPETEDTVSYHKDKRNKRFEREEQETVSGQPIRFPSLHYASQQFDAQKLKSAIESLVSRRPEAAPYFQGGQLPSEVSVFAHSGYRPGGVS
jgi:hypothetical protein